MTPESRNSSVNTANAGNDRRAVFSVVRAARAATQRCGKHISAEVNRHATIEEAVSSVGAAPRLYTEDLRQMRIRIEGVS
jgi:hypothetical protein